MFLFREPKMRMWAGLFVVGARALFTRPIIARVRPESYITAATCTCATLPKTRRTVGPALMCPPSLLCDLLLYASKLFWAPGTPCRITRPPLLTVRHRRFVPCTYCIVCFLCVRRENDDDSIRARIHNNTRFSCAYDLPYTFLFLFS